MATPLKPIECSAQPLCFSFHPTKDIVAAGLVDGTIELHDLIVQKSNNNDHSMENNNSDNEADQIEQEEEDDTILSTIYVAKDAAAKASTATETAASTIPPGKRATQGPSCRDVLFSRPAAATATSNGNGGEYLYTVCNGGSFRCLDSELACTFLHDDDASSTNNNNNNRASSPAILWSIESAHNVGINKLYQLPYNSPCGPLIATGDDVGTVRLWDTRICGSKQNQNKNKNNPFDDLMKPPQGCIQQWKVNHDYITDFECSSDGNSLLATCADGKLSVFDMRYSCVGNSSSSSSNGRGGKSIVLPEIDPNWDPTQNLPQSQQQQTKQQTKQLSTWESQGYTQSENQEDELLSCTFIKNHQKLICGTQEGILSLFSKDIWCDVSDRYPGHPQSIDAILKIDEDTVLTGSSDGLVRAVQLLPNSLLGVLGGHDGFPVEGLGWSAGRKVVGSVSHDEYIRLWVSFGLEECVLDYV